MTVAGIYVAATLLALCSLVVGRAFLDVLGGPSRSWLAPAAGFAVLLIAARLAIRLPGRASTALGVLALVVVASILHLALRKRPLGTGAGDGEAGAGALLVPIAVAVAVLVATSIPFLANAKLGVLGVGRQSDLQAHIYAADYLTRPVGFGPDAIANGYPLGPHALVAAISRLTGADTAASFVGLVLALPLLAAWTALAALSELPPLRRIVAATLVGLPYLVASFLGEGTFKEIAEALYLLAFALGLRALGRVPAERRAIVAMLVALIGASVYTYSYPGLVWPLGTLAIWAVLELIGGWRPPRPASWPRPSRRLLLAGGIALVALVVIALPEIRRAADFRHVVSQVADTKGRLRAPISPAQALGLWPSGNFRIDPRDAALATAMAIAALLALAHGLVFWLRRRELAVIAAFAAGTLVYLEAKRRSGLYIEAKSLAVLAPLPMLIALRALLAPATGRGRWRLVAGAAICVLAAVSSFMTLRGAQVGPRNHGDDLARVRQYIGGKRVLFLGLDRLSSHELRGAYVRQGNILASQYGQPRKPWTPADALDFDSIPPKRLNRFDYVVTTAAAFASQPPSNFHQAINDGAGPDGNGPPAEYLLWKRIGPVEPRATLFEAGSIGGRLRCNGGHSPIPASAHAAVIAGPRVGAKSAWRGGPYLDAGASASQTLNLPPGRWALSLQYHSPVPLDVRVPGELSVTLPPSLDGEVPYFEGGGPFWPAGGLAGQGPARITIHAHPLNGLQRLLGVHRRVALGKIAATNARQPERIVSDAAACGRFVDWYQPAGAGRHRAP
ncbi:MAG: hypothetical protein QOJ38_1999 [Solirubrobacterales bacterium]|nr:hypothetical protein [Solirubrobacterales bacterium]